MSLMQIIAIVVSMSLTVVAVALTTRAVRAMLTVIRQGQPAIGRTDQPVRRGLNVLKETFRPEFLNRLDETIVFTELSKDELKQIISLMFKEVCDEAAAKGLNLSFTDAAADFILEKGYDPKYGARPLRRTIQKYIEDELTERFFQGTFVAGSKVEVDVSDGNVVFK